MASLISVNIGRIRPVEYASLKRSGIDKRPTSGPVEVGPLGLRPDEIANPKFHGGPDKAVYAFAREDLDGWERELGVTLPSGTFGENLTTSGLDVNEALVGERWRIGSVLLEVRSIRTPCATFAGWLADNGVDTRGWARRFTAAARPGPYLRVVEPGTLREGDPIEVERRPDHAVTVALMFRALTTERSLLPQLLDVPDLVPQARAAAQRYVDGQSATG